MGVRECHPIRGSNDAALARRQSVLELLGRSPAPVTIDDAWRLARPRMTRREAEYAFLVLRRDGLIEVAVPRNYYGKLATYRLVESAATAARSA
jgi:hypothetical protein